MSTCTRCGAEFSCGMQDGGDGPCWCMALPPVVAVPVPLPAPGAAAPGCWCPACLAQHIAHLEGAASAKRSPS